MSTEVATLSECLVAARAGKGALASVLAEVIAQVATLLENAIAALEFALEEQFDTLCLRVLNLNNLVPFLRDILEGDSAVGCWANISSFLGDRLTGDLRHLGLLVRLLLVSSYLG